jgi:adenylate kinase family enzyme
MKNALPSAARVIVIGTSATGKSTFAQQLATIKSMPLVQLDPLFWDKEWLVDGNYGAVREQLWSKANVVIWLNYSLPVVLWRGLKRTVKRVISQQELWHGNKESFRRSFLSRESILVWILTTHARRTREFEALKASGEYTLEWIEFKHPRQAKQWLANRAKAA